MILNSFDYQIRVMKKNPVTTGARMNVAKVIQKEISRVVNEDHVAAHCS